MAVNLQISQLDDSGSDPTPAGGVVTYNVTIENVAADTAADTFTLFDLPAGTAAVNLPSFCTADAGVPTRIVCSHDDVAGTGGGGGAPISFQLQVSTQGLGPGIIDLASAVGQAPIPPAGTPLASLPPGDPFFGNDSDPADNVATQNTTLIAAGDLALSKTATPDPVVAGAEVTYTINVVNNGPSASSNFNVADTLPAGASFVVGSASGTGWTFSGANGTHAGPLVVGQTATYTFRALVTASSGALQNVAVVNAVGTPDPLTDNNTGSATVDIAAGADLQMQKTATPTPALPGQPVTFTLTVLNNGPSPAAGVSFSDTMPAGFLITNASTPAGWDCATTAADTVRSCNLSTGTLAVGASQTFTIEALVPATGPGSSGDQVNTATVTSTTPDPNPGNNAGTVNFTVLPDGADLGLSKSKSPNVIAIWPGPGLPATDSGYLMTSTINVENIGPRPASGNVQVVDQMAPGEEWFPTTTTPWTCTATAYAPPPARQQVTCDLDSGQLPLLAGQDAPSLVLRSFAHAEVDPAAVTNTACTGGSGGSLEPLTDGGLGDEDSSNDCSGAGVRPSPLRADMSLAKRTNAAGAADNTLPIGYTSMSYSIEVTNNGPDATVGVLVQDPIPGFIQGSTSATVTGPAGWNCAVSPSGTVTCRSGTLSLPVATPQTITVNLTGPLADSASRPAATCGATTAPAGSWCNTVGVGLDPTVPGSAGEIGPGNNSASDYVRVPRVANVQTTAKTIITGNAGSEGINSVYRIDYHNDGPSLAPAVVFRDVIDLAANDAGFLLVDFSRNGPAPTACTTQVSAQVTVIPGAGGPIFTTLGSGAGTLTILCPPLDMAGGQSNSLNVTLRPRANTSGIANRQYTNLADFYFDRNNDGVPDPSGGSDANGEFEYNTLASAADDEKTATLTVATGTLDLVVNKRDTGFASGVDPMGYDPNDTAGNFLTYEITTQNLGPSVATGVTIADTIQPPAGQTLQFIGASATAAGTYTMLNCTTTSGSNPTTGAPLTVTCIPPGAGFPANNNGVINSDATSRIFLRFQYQSQPAAGGDTVLNSVTAAANETDINPANSTESETTSVRSSADLAVSKRAIAATPAPDTDPNVALPAAISSVSVREPFNYVFEGVNNGPGSSLSLDRSGSNPLNGTGSVLVDTLPAGLLVTGPITWRKVGPALAGAVPNGTGSCIENASTVTCNVGDLTTTAGNPGRVRVIVPARWDIVPPGGTVNNTATVATEQVDKVSGNNQTTVPLEVTASSVAGTVFEDRDRAGTNGGVPQPGEPGIANVGIALTGTDAYGNAVNLNTTTDASGNYSFGNLSPADTSGYTLTQTQPTGYSNGPVNPPANGADAPSLGGTYAVGTPNSGYSAISVGVNTQGVRYNFPEVRRPSLSGFVYIDANFSNTRDAGSDGAIAGTVVELLNAATGVALGTTTTDASGAYRFDDLDPLIVYALREPLPTGGYQNRPTAINPGQIGGVACVACTTGTGLSGDPATSDRITGIDLGAGQDGMEFNFGEDAIAALSGAVYVDRNGNGDFDAADAGTINSQPNGGLQNVTVTLTGAGADGQFGNADDPAPVPMQTGADGSYQFNDLVVGQNYQVTEIQPAGYGNASENPGNVITVNALSAVGSSGHDFGELLGALSGVVFEDFSATAANNDNGLFDSGENPIANASLALAGIGVNGLPVNFAVQTDANGAYGFADLLPPQAGTFYTVTETQPGGYIDGKHTAGNAATPGNASVSNVISGIAISDAQEATGYNFGELANVVISGSVYLDRDDNGDRAATDIGIAGVIVTVVDAGPDGTFGNADDSSADISTDANGDWSYGGAITGHNYRLQETQPTGLADGQENTSNLIILTNLPLAGSTGNDFGELAASLAGNVFLDANNNGVREAGEDGIAGVSVQLPAGTVNALGQPVTAVTADGNGDYRFLDLLAGNYTVTEQLAQPVVAGVTTLNGITTAGTIDGASSGVATPVSMVPSAVSAIALPAGRASIDNNFAEILPVEVSGLVFFDINNDGAQAGAGETGIADVEIHLTGTDHAGAAVSLTLQTDAQGRFSFTDLRPGTYQLTEPQQPAGTSNGITTPGQVGGAATGTATPVTTVPSVINGIVLAQPGTASVNNLFGEIPLNSAISGHVWLDLDNDGVIAANESGIESVTLRLTGTDQIGATIERETATSADGSYAFTGLPPGTYRVTEPQQPVGTQNGQTVAGTAGGSVTTPAVTPSVISAIVLGVSQVAENNDFGELADASIDGRVYNDGDDDGIVDAGETGIAGVTLTLSGTDDLGNTITQSTVTDAEGRYRFDGLRAGSYTVTEPEQPPRTRNGLTTPGTIGGLPMGTATPRATLPSAISAITLGAGAVSVENNFGEIGDSPDMLVTKSAAPARFTVNNPAVYTVTVRNGGQQPSRGEYVVRDRLPAGITVAATPTGNGWSCDGAVGDGNFTCRSSTVIVAGQTSSDAITIPVLVGTAAATGEAVNNVVLVDGGGEEEHSRPTPEELADFEGNVTGLPACDPLITQNACRVPTEVQLAASLSGTVWFDLGSEDTLLDGADRRLQGWTVELVDPATGEVVRSTTTAADGSYRIGDLIPGVLWDVRFRDPASGSLWGWPVSGETASGPAAPCNAGAAITNGTASSCRSSEDGVSQLQVVLRAGQNLPEQSLPVDPSGVVYDALTRDPVPGSVVTLAPVGVCAGFDPATSLLNAAGGGYLVEGSAVSITVGNDGYYQFLFGPAAPARCEFQLTVTPPGNYAFVSTIIVPQTQSLSPPGAAGTSYLVQDNADPPSGPVGPATQYYLNFFAGSQVAGMVHNHIPLDSAVPPGLSISKTGDRQTVEIGDTLQYTITIRQTAGAPMDAVSVIDTLPRGFTYIDSTARANNTGIADPLGKPGPKVVFSVGPISVGEQIVLNYRVRVGVGADKGDGVNHAQAHGCSIVGGCVNPETLLPEIGTSPSNKAEYRVRVTGGVFTDEGCVLGKIFVDCNVNHMQDREEIGIPGVRLYFEDGTWLISDSEGKYSYCGLTPSSHTLKVDASTLPTGSRLTTSSNRNLGDADSLFIDLKNGELHRADFIEGSCSNPVLEQVKARRTQGEVRAPESESGQSPLRFESKPARMPPQGTDSARQRPIVEPRPTPPEPAILPQPEAEP